MKKLGLNEIREKYIKFFEGKGHLAVKSYPLVPINDKSLLLINSGMAPLKKFFTGESEPPSKRLVDCQKCIRTNDIDSVGITSRHGSFFEMLGNFSFGDYFKSEAIKWAYEFLAGEMEVDLDRLWVTVYELDEDAAAIWEKTGIPPDRIVRLGKEDNFWEIGAGPCGPDTEIFFDRGVEHGCGDPDCRPGCDCDRFVEIWNLVFTQFNGDGEGGYVPLANPNIDTGMGLERISYIVQGANNLFEVDTIRTILNKVCEISGRKYGENDKTDISIRIITDHIRSTVFLIGDGVMPSNEGRGYVLRRLIRRAYRHGRLLGIDGAFLTSLTKEVVALNCAAYPELSEKEEYVEKIIRLEEERFASTLDSGMALLEKLIEATAGNVISGEDVFRLSDTYGFPFDITREIASEKGYTLDEEGFARCMEEQKTRARAARKEAGDEGLASGSSDVLNKLEPTKFCGYALSGCETEVLALIDGETGLETGTATSGKVKIILKETPFYAEGGGQVGDIGYIGNASCTARVTDTQKKGGIFIHAGELVSGSISTNDLVRAEIDSERREAIKRNHSAAHLLQSALRGVLGEHIAQSGSFVDQNRLRFDFSHFEGVKSEEIRKIEELVNDNILRGIEIETFETDIESAKKMGALALFGEKYGKNVRVVKMGDISSELCGGTHTDNTAKIGLFKIISESSVAAGVRRIEAICGLNLLNFLREKEELINETARILRAGNPNDIALKSAAIENELKEEKAKNDSLLSSLASLKTAGMYNSAVEIGSCRLAILREKDMDVAEARKACDSLKDAHAELLSVIAIQSADKLNFAASCGKDAVARGANAGSIVKKLGELTGGNGGGRADSAVAGGKDTSKLENALTEIKGFIESMLS